MIYCGQPKIVYTCTLWCRCTQMHSLVYIRMCTYATMIIMMVFSFYAAIIMAFANFFSDFVPCLYIYSVHLHPGCIHKYNIIAKKTRHGNTISIWLLHRWFSVIHMINMWRQTWRVFYVYVKFFRILHFYKIYPMHER